LTYLSLENDLNNSTAHTNNCYCKGIEVWVRSALRYIDSTLIVNPVVEDSPPPQEQNSSDDSSDMSSNKSEPKSAPKKPTFGDDEIIELLTRIENVLDTSYGLPLSFRLELYLLLARVYRRKFAHILLNM
jgi:hypothetical protein